MSILQDYPSLEVIVVDDNSNDKTLRKVQDVRGRARGLREDISLPTHRLKIITVTEKPVAVIMAMLPFLLLPLILKLLTSILFFGWLIFPVYFNNSKN